MATQSTQPSIEHSRIIRAFERNVPGCYVKDYSSTGGYITIMRGARTFWDGGTRSENGSGVPAETLCAIPRGAVQAPSMFRGMQMVRPGWRREMKKAADKLTESQKRAIERDLGVKVFRA